MVVPDLRGYGRSRGLPPPYAAAELASDLSGLLDHLGVDSTAVLGCSQGGAIAQQLALDHP
jgi:pimeloyl-ACP methyl ester carboxylesterase